jgi:uncharacterized protein YbaP (TraB family)
MEAQLSIVWRITAMKTLVRIIAGLILTWGAQAAAQPLQRSADPEGAIVEELVVRARLPGPAWWKVSSGDSVVWILGAPYGLPKGVTWSDGPLGARLEGAKALILPPDVHVAPLKVLAYFITHRGSFKSNAPLEPGLPPELAARFAKAREALGKPASRYAGWRPAVAGMLLDGDVRTAARIQLDQPKDRIRALGRKAHVKEERIADYDLTPLMRVLANMSGEVHLECLSDALDQADAGPDGLTQAARGWASGDVRAALAAQRGSDRCLAALPQVGELLQRRQAETAAAIKASLATPGHAVAVVELRSLLSKGGVLDRLRAEGVRVQTPDSAN